MFHEFVRARLECGRRLGAHAELSRYHECLPVRMARQTKFLSSCGPQARHAHMDLFSTIMSACCSDAKIAGFGKIETIEPIECMIPTFRHEAHQTAEEKYPRYFSSGHFFILDTFDFTLGCFQMARSWPHTSEFS